MIYYPKLKSVTVIGDFKLLLEFEDSEKRIYNFKPHLDHPYFSDLSDDEVFSRVNVEDGEIIWETGQDFCPNTLYEQSEPYGSCSETENPISKQD